MRPCRALLPAHEFKPLAEVLSPSLAAACCSYSCPRERRTTPSTAETVSSGPSHLLNNGVGGDWLPTDYFGVARSQRQGIRQRLTTRAECFLVGREGRQGSFPS